MAIMIPTNPVFDENTHEDLVFKALQELPQDCYVLHSLHILDPQNNKLGKKKETEIDFIVLIPNVGCIVIEVKSGSVSFTDSTSYFDGEEIPPYTWVYESGRPMSGGGPFRQSRDNMYILKKYLESSNYSTLSLKQKFFSCVWFPQTPVGKVNNLPKSPDCPKQCILSSDSLKSPLEALLKVVQTETTQLMEEKESWNKSEINIIINNVLAPTMSLVPGKNWEYESKTEVMNRLLIEQQHILDFLSEQKIAVISGAAGTGKTMIALEKARRESESSNALKVLFLCYNTALCDYLRSNYAKKNIDYFTLDSWACSLCHSSKPDYGALVNIIDKEVLAGSFPYKAIIVDEGQDFGQETSDNASINVLESLQEAMILNEGCFYLFYDKNQVVNSKKIPSYISNAECRLTLHKNCRNTIKIAEASMAPIGEEPKMKEDVTQGTIPELFLTDKIDTGYLAGIIDRLSDQYKNIVVLTAKAYNSSSLLSFVKGHKIEIGKLTLPFFTCRQYKGLEADAIVLVDVDKDTFLKQEERLLYYVGTSRAKFSLSIVATLSNYQCKDICLNLLGDDFIQMNDYFEELATSLRIQLMK